jgi:Fur family peroxide stress response transcriptional regulator
MQHSPKNDSAIIEALRGKGYKATSQRIAISKIALASREHPSVQKIYHEIRKTQSTVSLATVYSTLNILKESGLIQELNFPQGQTRYDPNLEPHINLVCLACGRIQDIDDAEARELIKKATAKAEFRAANQRIDIYGRCGQCSKV